MMPPVPTATPDGTATPAPATPLAPAERALCHTQGCWLRAVLQFAPLAWLCAALALACGLHDGVVWLAAAALLLALAERWHALRLRFDADLFALLGSGALVGTTEVQTALHRLRLRRQPPDAAPRPLADMLRGCQRLVWRYAACVLGLVALTAICLLRG